MVHDEVYSAIDWENAVIGSLLLDNTLIEEIEGELRSDDFTGKLNREAFKTILEMKHKNELPADFLTVAAKMKVENYTEGEKIGYLGQLIQSTFSPSNAKHYAQIVKKESMKRKRKIVLSEALRMENQGESDSFDFLRREMEGIENNAPCIVKPFSFLVDKTMESLDRDFNRKTKLTGMASEFNELDNFTHGFQRGNLIIIAARPSMGKSMLAQNIADNIGLKQKLPVVFFSLEMTYEELVKRSLSRFAKIESEHLFGGNLNDKDWESLTIINSYVSGSKVYINDRPQLSIEEMRAYCRKVKSQDGLSAIFVDYLGLIGGEGENETMRVTKISASLKALAKDFDVPVIALAQLNRELEGREDKRPRMSDIRQSGAIEQDADLIIFLYCEEEYKPDTHKKNEAELIVAKNRNGKKGTILLRRNRKYFEFSDYGI